MATPDVPKKQVLVVDDEPMLREILEFEIADMGFTPLCAANGREALALVKSHPIHAVVSDIRMPGGDGVELLDAIRSYNLETPCVVLMSGYTDLTLEDAYDKGAIAMFAKPLDIPALKELLGTSLAPKDRRWSERLDGSMLEGKIELAFGDAPPRTDACAVNFGHGGMFVSLSGAYPPRFNTVVSFKITCCDAAVGVLEGAGIVRWIRMQERGTFPSGMGIEFKFLSEACRQQVIALIDAGKTRAYIPKG